MSDPVVYAEQQFNALKSFMRRQPSSWAPTDNAVVDAANKVRSQLSDTKFRYADTIAHAIKNAAEIYKMNPRRLKVTINTPMTPNDHINLRQQKRIIELHQEFRVFLKEHELWCNNIEVNANGVYVIERPDPKPTDSPPPPQSHADESVLKWFFLDNNNVRQGPISDEQLKTIVQRGIVTPTTAIETIYGYKGTADQIKGLFSAPPTTIASHPSVSNVVPPTESEPLPVRNIFTMLTTSSITATDSRLKAKIYRRIFLWTLILLVLVWLPTVFELLLKNGTYKWGDFSMFSSFVIIPVGLVSFILWIREWSVQGLECPNCDALPKTSLLTSSFYVSSEERNKRKTTERREIQKRDADGKTISTGKHEDVPVTKYMLVQHHQCSFCGHKWTKKHEASRDGHSDD